MTAKKLDAVPEIALRLAARGIPSFPCMSNKHPATPHGFKNATADKTALCDLWRRYRGDLVGVPTGPVSGFDVLDVDPRHGGEDWLADISPSLPETRVHQTRSGGVHLFFRHRPGTRNSESKIAPGIDVRGNGGYVIWWPGFGGAVISPTRPADWPDWLADLAMPLPAPKPELARERPQLAANSNRENEAAFNLIGRALLSVESATPGQRHYRLRAAARTIGGLIDAAGISTHDAERVLLDAAQRAGAEDIRAAAATVSWGLENGRGAPLAIGGAR